MGDLNNTNAARPTIEIRADPAYIRRSIAIADSDDDGEVRRKYRPFLLDAKTIHEDWVSKLELATVTKMAEQDLKSTGERLKVLLLFGSLRRRLVSGSLGFVEFCLSRYLWRIRSYSRLVALEASRILFRLGCDVRVYDPTGLPVKDDVQHSHKKVQELRELSRWSDGHVWVSPEQHGNLVRDSSSIWTCSGFLFFAAK